MIPCARAGFPPMVVATIRRNKTVSTRGTGGARGARMSNKASVTVLLLASFVIAGRAGAQSRAPAQSNPIIGSWQHTEPESPRGPGNVQTMSFGADGNYVSRWYIAPQDQQSGGATITSGVYRMTDSSTIEFQPLAGQVCSSGGACVSCPAAYPPCEVMGIGRVHQGSFRMDGRNRMLSGGMTWFRASHLSDGWTTILRE